MENKPKILCIDDDPDTLEMLAVLIPTRGLSVECCNSAREALAAFNLGVYDPLRRFDCIVSDVDLRRMSGITILKLVRKHLPLIPFFLLSGYGCITMRGLAEQAGTTGFFSKPILNPKSFLDRIEEAAEVYHKRPKETIPCIVLPREIEEMIAVYDERIRLGAAA